MSLSEIVAVEGKCRVYSYRPSIDGGIRVVLDLAPSEKIYEQLAWFARSKDQNETLDYVIVKGDDNGNSGRKRRHSEWKLVDSGSPSEGAGDDGDSD